MSELSLLLLHERFGRLVYFWHQDFVDNMDNTIRVHQIRFDDCGFLYLKQIVIITNSILLHTALSLFS
jgi:hypothetical protein